MDKYLNPLFPFMSRSLSRLKYTSASPSPAQTHRLIVILRPVPNLSILKAGHFMTTCTSLERTFGGQSGHRLVWESFPGLVPQSPSLLLPALTWPAFCRPCSLGCREPYPTWWIAPEQAVHSQTHSRW